MALLELFELRADGRWYWRQVDGLPVSETDARLFGLVPPLPTAA